LSETLFNTEITADPAELARALARAGTDANLRETLFEALRRAETKADDPASFREQVRWPLVMSLLGEEGTHRVRMKNGLVFEVGPDSRIEQALLLSLSAEPDHVSAEPDHVWEPQTTRLLVALSSGAEHVIVGGAYIGDHVLFIARELAKQSPPGVVHAFEPMPHTFNRLVRNLELNDAANVTAHQLGLWDRRASLSLDGPAALASSLPLEGANATAEGAIESVSIDEYVQSKGLSSVGLIMLDTEGGEERALLGARELLSRPGAEAPHVVFEVHRHFVDWSNGLENTSVVRLMTESGYEVYAVRDLHGNRSMEGQPIEVIPVDRVYLEGPPHGFNMLASKDRGVVGRLGLRVVTDVSPKLLPEKDPALHHPLGGWES
jgi:FkbM family methyltransferase